MSEELYKGLLKPDQSLTFKEYKDFYIQYFPFIVINHKFNGSQIDYEVLSKIEHEKITKWITYSELNKDSFFFTYGSISINLIDLYWNLMNTVFHPHTHVIHEEVCNATSSSIISRFAPNQYRIESRQTFAHEHQEEWLNYLEKNIKFY